MLPEVTFIVFSIVCTCKKNAAFLAEALFFSITEVLNFQTDLFV